MSRRACRLAALVTALATALALGACDRDASRGNGGGAGDTTATAPGPPADTSSATPVGAPTDTIGEGPPAAPADTAWTAGNVTRDRPHAPAVTLVAVRSARQEGFDRVVFEFAERTLPGVRAEYVDRPVRDCGAGEVVPVAGDAWLRIALHPANAHDELGRATAAPRETAPRLPVLLEIQRTCDFEAVVEYVLGVASPNRYRVLELADPARVVVDIRHAPR